MRSNEFRKILTKGDDFTYAIIIMNLDTKKMYYVEYEGRGCVGREYIRIRVEWLKNLPLFKEEINKILNKWKKYLFEN